MALFLKLMFMKITSKFDVASLIFSMICINFDVTYIKITLACTEKWAANHQIGRL